MQKTITSISKWGSLNGIDRERKVIALGELKDDHGELLMPSRELEYDILVIKQLVQRQTTSILPAFVTTVFSLDSPENQLCTVSVRK